jgi:TatA/E family protein of Tat protein translocase
MFDIGFQEIVVIGVIALLVFGPSKLPELGRMFGRALREFRRASDEFRTTVETNLHINDVDPVIVPTPAAAPASTAPATLPSELEPPAPEMSETPATETQGEATPPEITEPYCAQRGARLFHRRECGWARRIPEVERVYLKRVADARDQGFAECPVCEPWEPA